MKLPSPASIGAVWRARDAAPAAPGRTSAAAQPPLTPSARLVCQAIVLKDRLLVLRLQLVVGAIHGAPFTSFLL